MSSGVTALDSIRISAEVILSQPMKSSVVSAADRVREGEHISDALEQTGYFSPIVLQLIEIGESSGKLGEMLERSAKAEEKRIHRYHRNFYRPVRTGNDTGNGAGCTGDRARHPAAIFDMNDLLQ